MPEWKPTVYRGYFVSEDGDVRGPSGRVLRVKLRGKGYPSVTVSGNKTAYVHQLVCNAFHGPRPDPAYQVAHGNGNPRDNRAANLRWATPAENTEDSRRHGTHCLRPGGAGERNGHARLTWDDVALIRSEFATGQVTQQALAKRFAIGKSQVHNIVTGKSWLEREEWRP